MRGWMQTKFSLAVIMGVASVIILASCLVDSKKNKTNIYKITPPAQLPVYSNGHYISMLYESYQVGASPQSPSSGITMSWQESFLPLPFNLGNLSALRFVFKEASGSAVQYITQDATRSIFLRAFEGIGSTVPGSQTHTFWPNKGAVLTGEPTPLQVFWSPIEDGIKDGVGIDRAANKALDFNIVGECDPTPCESYGTMVAFQPKAGEGGVGFAVTAGQDYGNTIQPVVTPLGTFETYNIRYAGTLVVTDFPTTFDADVGFDYRTSCLPPGQAGTVSFEGEIWIYPPIGPVKIRNVCSASGSLPISYTAQIVGTNLPFE